MEQKSSKEDAVARQRRNYVVMRIQELNKEMTALKDEKKKLDEKFTKAK